VARDLLLRKPVILAKEFNGKAVVMRTRSAHPVLVVGAAASFFPAFEELEGRGYRFEAVADTEAARTYLLRQPADAVLLCLPAARAEAQSAFAWLRAIKEELPVVVISGEADMQPYLAAMQCGAFDYFTSLTPVAEMQRVLANAVRWRRQKVA